MPCIPNESELADIVKTSATFQEVIQRAKFEDLPYLTQRHEILSACIDILHAYNIDDTHLVQNLIKQSNNPNVMDTIIPVRPHIKKKDLHLHMKKKYILKALSNTSKVNLWQLRNGLIKFGFKTWQCEECKETTWRGKPIPLDVHHRNRNSKDNQLTNLQLLCPNCHAQQHRTPVDLSKIQPKNY